MNSTLLLLLMLVTQTAAGSHLQTPYVWRFFARETYRQGNNIVTHTVGDITCPKSGCAPNMKMTIPTSAFGSTEEWTSFPALCLLHDQPHDYCYWWPDRYGGCPYYQCDMNIWNSIHPLEITIKNPNDPAWKEGVKGKIYGAEYYAGPIADIYIYKAWVPQDPKLVGIYNLTSTIQKQEKVLATNLAPETSKPFSWLGLLREGARLLNISGSENTKDCFLCAFLNRPPITAVPLNSPLNTTGQTQNSFALTNVPLYQEENIPGAAVCYGAGAQGSCNTTISVPSPGLTSPPGTFFWCNGTLRRSIPSNLSAPCFPSILVPQLLQYQEGELHALITRTREKRAVFLPVLVGLAATTSLVGAGLGGASMATTLQSHKQLREELEKGLDAAALSLASLQRQVTSLAAVVMQNRRALDLLTEEKGGTCLFLQEQCCYYVNESGIVEENIHKLQDIRVRLRDQGTNWAPTPWWQSTVYSVLTPILGPLLILFLVVSIGPCLLRTTVQQLESVVTRRATAKILTLQGYRYRKLPSWTDGAETEDSV